MEAIKWKRKKSGWLLYILDIKIQRKEKKWAEGGTKMSKTEIIRWNEMAPGRSGQIARSISLYSSPKDWSWFPNAVDGCIVQQLSSLHHLGWKRARTASHTLSYVFHREKGRRQIRMAGGKYRSLFRPLFTAKERDLSGSCFTPRWWFSNWSDVVWLLQSIHTNFFFTTMT